MKTVEIWKDIPGYEGLYQVSNLGNVKSLNYHREGYEKILVNILKKDGYLTSHIKRKAIRTHRLVCLAFLDNPENKPYVNHIDGDKQNNCVENLEWCTASENCLHSYKIGLSKVTNNNIVYINNPMKGKFGKKHNRSKKVNQYDLQNNFIKTWDCIMDIERELLINHTNISACCKGKLKTIGGFIFKYYH